MHIYAHVHVNICVQVHVCICAQVHVNICAHVHVNICVQVYRIAIALAYDAQFQIATKNHATSAATMLYCSCWEKSNGTTTGARRELGEQEMKKIQDMEIKRMWFQVKELTAAESKSWVNHWNNRLNYSRDIYTDIYDAYKKPSEAKVSVWNEWVQWAKDVNMFDDTHEVKNLRICAHNNQMFTVCTIIREFDKEEIGIHLPVATYIMVATKYHNRLYLLTSDESGEDIEC